MFQAIEFHIESSAGLMSNSISFRQSCRADYVRKQP